MKGFKSTIILGMIALGLASFSLGINVGKLTYKPVDLKVDLIESKGDKVVYTLNDGSFAMVKDGVYYFQPANMDDYDYEFNNKKDWENCIKTYNENR